MEAVERERYFAYIKGREDAAKAQRDFELEIAPHAVEILKARYNNTPYADYRTVYFSKDRFWVDGMHHDDSYACRVELLFEKDWQAMVEETLRQEQRRLDTLAEVARRRDAAALEKREREQLAVLLKKYPLPRGPHRGGAMACLGPGCPFCDDEEAERGGTPT